VHATRYRLRFIAGVSLSSATYGSGQYGSQTYGTVASDPLASLRYRLVPWPAGYLPDPAWEYRQGDTRPSFKAVILGDEGSLQLVGVVQAKLVLTPMDRDPDPPRTYDLTVSGPTASGSYWLNRNWLAADLVTAGAYRAGVVITYSSGRRLSIPVDDRQVFVIAPNSAVAGSTGARWDEPGARWDESTWATT
jgi:hypothetical protein